MGFDFASAKRTARRVVHDTLGVSASYQDDSMDEPVPIVARWHNRILKHGDLENAGYAEMVETVNRIALFPEDTPEIEFRIGGVVTFDDDNRAFTLVVQEPQDGPLQVIWQVAEA